MKPFSSVHAVLIDMLSAACNCGHATFDPSEKSQLNDRFVHCHQPGKTKSRLIVGVAHNILAHEAYYNDFKCVSRPCGKFIGGCASPGTRQLVDRAVLHRLQSGSHDDSKRSQVGHSLQPGAV